MKAALIVVNYLSAAHSISALASARKAFAGRLECILVDNSLQPAEAERLQAAGADQLIISKKNGGYSGGLNAGLARTDAEVVILSNPDVLYSPGSLDRLAEEALGKNVIAGPRITWDDAGEFMLPSPEMPRPWRKRFEIAAAQDENLARVLDLARFRSRMETWSATEPVSVSALSGAILAVPTRFFRQVGLFDERFELYFEEVDFLKRSHDAGIASHYLPDVHCRHFFNQSASLDPTAGQKFVNSEVAFYEKWFDGAVVQSMRRKIDDVATQMFRRVENIELALEPGEAVVELSPLPDFRSAVGHFPSADIVVVPDEIRKSVTSRLFARVLERESGRVVHAVELH